MKKLFASLMAATMVAGMSVSAFAYADKAGANGTSEVLTSSEIGWEDDNDYALGNPSVTNESTIFGGDKIRIPILVDAQEVEDDDDIDAGYFYATKASEIEDVKVSYKETEGKGSIKSVVVKKTDSHGISGADFEGKKLYCVEIELNDYFETEESELEFDLTLKNGSKKMVEVEDEFCYTVGKDDGNSTLKNAVDEDGNPIKESSESGYGYEAKFKDNLLELTVGENTKAVTLDEFGDEDDNEIEELYMETADGEMIVEGKMEEQDALFLGFELDPTDFQKEVMMENDKADVDTFNWVARPTFDFSMDVTVPVEDDRDNFLYEEIDGKLVEVEAKLNDDGDELKFETKTLGKYLLSDMELTAEKAEKEEAGEEATDAKEETEAKEDSKKANAETGASLVAVATAIALF